MDKTKIKESLPLRMAKLVLVVSIIVGIGSTLGVLGYYLTKQKPVIQPPVKSISKIEISTDAKSILNSDTKVVIFTIADTQKYLKDSGYFYNPNTFQTTNAKYEGDCFSSATLSNNKDRIVFSTGCLLGDLPQAWIGIYDFGMTRNFNDCTGFNDIIPSAFACIGNQNYKPFFKFIAAGGGKNFIWSQDDKTITYEADLGLSGMTETRTIDSQTGEVVLIKNPCTGYENDVDSTNCINDFLSKNLISSEIVNSDDKIKNYLSQIFDLQDFKGISRGKFTDKPNVNTIIFTFDNTQNKSTLIFIVNELENGKWQAYYQNLDTFEILINSPVEIVKNKAPFFQGKNLPMSGTCTSTSWSDNIYKLENNKFKKIWSINTFVADQGEQPKFPAKTNNKTSTILVDTKLSFEDVNKDGNKEIIRQGTKKIWKGYCNNLDKDLVKTEKIYEIYKWNSQKQTFVRI